MQCVQCLFTVKNAAAAILLSGVAAGESPCLVTLPATGTSYVTAAPLSHARRLYGVTRRFAFREGRPVPRGAGGAAAGEETGTGAAAEEMAADTVIYDWGRGLFEAEMRCGELAEMPERAFPYTLAQRAFEGMTAVLYYENGLWLSLESGRRLLSGFAMGEAASGALYGLGRMLAAVASAADGDFARVIAPDRSEVLAIRADRITVEGAALTAIERLKTQRGHERRTVYTAGSDGALHCSAPEVGFFTHAGAEPASVPLALCEAVRLGRIEEARTFMTKALSDALSDAAIADFFGAYLVERPFLSDSDTVGLVMPEENGVYPVRRIAFELLDGRVENITEAD